MARGKRTSNQTPTLLNLAEVPSVDKFAATADKIIDGEVRQRRVKYKWSNDGEAFAHLFVQHRFDLSEDEAAQACQIGRAGHDHGVDAYFFDDDHISSTGALYIVQSKSSRAEHDDKVLTRDVTRALEYLAKGSVEGVKPQLAELLDAYQTTLEKQGEIVVVLGLNGKADKVRAAIPDFETQQSIRVQIEVFDADDLRALVMRPRHIPESGPNVVFTNLPVEPWILPVPAGEPRLMTCAVKAQELAIIIRKHRLAVFRLNVREYLGSKNPVNKVVAQSIKTHPSKFHYLNLGIDAVCESTKVTQVDSIEGISWSLDVRNLQIVNGCQTAKTISEVDVASDALVMLRLIEVVKDQRDELVPEISVAKNRQSPIHGRDLFAWDRSQLRLHKEFEELGYFFERREKEWEAFSKHQATAKRLFPNGRLDNTVVARAYLATYLQDPFRAKHRKKDFFIYERDGGVFERIFEQTSASKMLLAYKIYDFAMIRSKQFGKQFRELTKQAENHKLSDDDAYKLEQANVVWNADTYIAALMSFFIGTHYKVHLNDDHDASITQHVLKLVHDASSSRRVFEPIFDKAREVIIELYLVSKKQLKTPSLFTPRRFFYQEDTYAELLGHARAKSLQSITKPLKPLHRSE